MPSAMIFSFEFETVATLKVCNSIIFSLILKRWVRFGNLFELSTSICNRNFAIFCRLGVTLISVEDIFEGDEKLNLKLVCDPPIKISSCRGVLCSYPPHLSLRRAYRTPRAIGVPTAATKQP